MFTSHRSTTLQVHHHEVSCIVVRPHATVPPCLRHGRRHEQPCCTLARQQGFCKDRAAKTTVLLHSYSPGTQARLPAMRRLTYVYMQHPRTKTGPTPTNPQSGNAWEHTQIKQQQIDKRACTKVPEQHVFLKPSATIASCRKVVPSLGCMQAVRSEVVCFQVQVVEHVRCTHKVG
jgi:hypothetical protein